MPQPIRTVAPFFKMSNMAYEGIELDWKDPPLHRFFDKQPIIGMTHGWQEKWGPLHWLNDAHDRVTDLVRMRAAGPANTRATFCPIGNWVALMRLIQPVRGSTINQRTVAFISTMRVLSR